MSFTYRHDGTGPAEFPDLVLFDADGEPTGSALDPGEVVTLDNEYHHPHLVATDATAERHGFAVVHERATPPPPRPADDGAEALDDTVPDDPAGDGAEAHDASDTTTDLAATEASAPEAEEPTQ